MLNIKNNNDNDKPNKKIIRMKIEEETTMFARSCYNALKFFRNEL